MVGIFCKLHCCILHKKDGYNKSIGKNNDIGTERFIK